MFWWRALHLLKEFFELVFVFGFFLVVFLLLDVVMCMRGPT